MEVETLCLCACYKLIEAGFDYVRYSDKDEVAIYRKRK